MAKTPDRGSKAPPIVRSCGAVVMLQMAAQADPEIRVRRATFEAFHARRMSAKALGPPPLVTIPVVVHVVWKKASENVSDAQIASQMRVLNRDYAAKNVDRKSVPAVWASLVGDARIRFALATKDPDGKATTGVTRTKTTKATFSYAAEAMKFTKHGGHDAWPTDRYLNLWVCSLADSLLGFAQFPGEDNPETDGVVILNTAFGTTGTATAPFHLGRTAVHEVGHWLNLTHIWGESSTASCSDGDSVPDTPNQLRENTGKPTFPHLSCPRSPNGDMFMNYMDYVDDDTMVMFTKQQVDRMRSALEGPRKSFVTRRTRASPAGEG